MYMHSESHEDTSLAVEITVELYDVQIQSGHKKRQKSADKVLSFSLAFVMHPSQHKAFFFCLFDLCLTTYYSSASIIRFELTQFFDPLLVLWRQ